MKPAQTPQPAPDAPVRVEFQVKFAGGPKGRRRARVAAAAEPCEQESPGSASRPAPEPLREASLSRVPKITRLLVLGHHFENLVREGVVKDYVEIARLTGLSRARVTQIANLTLLAPEIQEEILRLPPPLRGCNSPREHYLRPLLLEDTWSNQQRAWHR